MIVLQVFAEFLAHSALDLPLHTGFTATDERATDLYAIGRRDDPSSRPLRLQNAVALQTASLVTAEGQQRLGVLMEHGVAMQSSLREPIRRRNTPRRHSASIWCRTGNWQAAPRKTASKTFFQECRG